MAQLVEIWRGEQRRFWSLFVLFLLGSVLSYVTAEQVMAMLKQTNLFAPFQQILKDVLANPTFANTFTTIFLNNFYAVFRMIGLGLFFGIGPIFALLGNGMLLGIVLNLTHAQLDIHPIWTFITRILPHGILELPAVIFAAAVGVHLGWLVIKGLVALVTSRKREQVGQEWRQLLLRLPLILAALTVLLLVAAGIESALIVLA